MKRAYATVAHMNEVAKSQWRSFYDDGSGQEWSDDELWNMAQATISIADETGEFFDSFGNQKFTMEMESWARDTTDGIEEEIEILEWDSPELRQTAEELLETKLTDAEYVAMRFGWHAFSTEPEKYRDTIVPGMVTIWLRERREK